MSQGIPSSSPVQFIDTTTWTNWFVYVWPKRKHQRKNVEIIQPEIVGHGELYVYAVF